MADAQKQMEASETEVGPIDPAILPEGVTFAAGPPSSDGEVTGGPAAYYWSGGAGWRKPRRGW